jgi:hypothetical protein
MTMTTIEALADDVEALAGNLRTAYEMWPPDHRMYGHMPGLVASVLLEGLDYEDFTPDQVPEIVALTFDKAGLAGHAHIDEVSYIVAEASKIE